MKKISIGPYELESGVVIPDVVVQYASYGSLNDTGDNVVLATHGYTSGPAMIDGGAAASEGSWSSLVGPGCVIDTNHHHVICPNILGSSYGTTGPSSINSLSKEPWGPTFPAITLRDIVGVQYRMLKQQGVKKLRAVVGPSYGGIQALQWALDYPDVVEAIGVVVSGFRGPLGFTAERVAQKLATCPDWNGGWHHCSPSMTDFMASHRRDTLELYGLKRYLCDHFSAAECQRIIENNCREWSAEFDPCSLIVLARALEAFDARQRLGEIRAKMLVAVCSTDALFPPDDQTRQLVESLPGEARYIVIESPYGHMASGLDWKKFEPELAWLLRD